MSIRIGSKNTPVYDKQLDLDYTEHILISILMFCGYTDFNLSNYNIDQVIEAIKETLPNDTGEVYTAAQCIIDQSRSAMLVNYRRYWFNRQLILGVTNDT